MDDNEIKLGLQFAKKLADTGKFSRNKISQILFEVEPHDYVHVSGAGALTAILVDLGIGKVGEGYERRQWCWINNNKFALPRTGTVVRS